eukprot:14443384-Alexandrium_andersonii.AAC.1
MCIRDSPCAERLGTALRRKNRPHPDSDDASTLWWVVGVRMCHMLLDGCWHESSCWLLVCESFANSGTVTPMLARSLAHAPTHSYTP